MVRIIVFALFLAVSSTFSVVYAQENTEATKTSGQPVERVRNIQATGVQRREDMRVQVRTRLAEAKQGIVERVQKNINAINERRTNHFFRVLERLENILERIESRKDKAKENGKDATSVEQAITDAKEAINDAKDAVTSQKEKEYEIVVESDATARNDVGETVKALQEDLRSVREKVHAAREAVHKALRLLTALQGNAGADVTPTGNAVTVIYGYTRPATRND